MPKREKPIKIIPHGRKHKLETRVFARNIHETFCAQKGCKFHGKHAAQGICHTDKPSILEWRHFEALLNEGEKFLKETRRIYKKKSRNEYIAHLEAMISVTWANYDSCLMELIHMRKENAKLKQKLGIYK